MSKRVYKVKPRGNGRNIVGQLPTLSGATRCVRLHTLHPCVLLGIVERSMKLVTRLNQQLPTFILFRDVQSVAQQCWIPFAQRFQSIMGRILPTTHYTSLHCWELLRPFARNYQHHPTSAEPTTANNVGSRCVRLRTTTNTIQHLQNQQLPTMLGTVASVCAQKANPCAP